MGQNSSSMSIKNYTARIETKDGKIFKVSYHSLVQHILLLRQVINNTELTKEGPILDSFIKEYCKRMVQGEMKTPEQQTKLPWQIEWIWHVHRLHPIAYLNDCIKQLSDGLVDTKARECILNQKKKCKSKMIFPSNNNHSLFVPSVDLTNAVIRQKDFLDKFQKHPLHSYDLQTFNELKFQNLVQDYVSFIKLAKKNQMIVPTFDIDLIWHTHMRYPSHYHEFCKALCGFILDHNDALEPTVLSDAFQTTADRWKQTYQSEYGENVDRKHLLTYRYMSACAMVFSPLFIQTANQKPVHAAWLTGCASGGTNCGGGYDGDNCIDGDASCGGDSGGGCDGGSGGDGGGGGDSGGGGDGGGCGGCGGD